MKALAAAAMLIGLCSCATAPAPESSVRSCDASKAQSLVGQAASGQLAAEAQRLSGAEMVRWLQPGQIITMEFRADRLNLVLDAQNKIQSIRCG
jgi:hypothetical protein